MTRKHVRRQRSKRKTAKIGRKKAVKRVRWKKRVAKRKRAKKPKQKAAPYEGDYPPPRREA